MGDQRIESQPEREAALPTFAELTFKIRKFMGTGR